MKQQFGYAIVLPGSDHIEKHFGWDDYATCLTLAVHNKCDIWETFEGNLYALSWRYRPAAIEDLRVEAIKSGKITEGPKMLAELFNRR